MDNGQSTKVVNWYETDDYKTKVNRVREWYKAGYIKLDAATSTDVETSLVMAGSLFAYFSYIKPGFLEQANAQCGREMVYAYIGTDDGKTLNNLSSSNVNFFNWGIAQNAKDKVKAMRFLNFAYSSPEFMNLLNWGIEGEHYVFVDSGKKVIDYPPGIDATNAKYGRNLGWHFPNQYIAHIWTGLPGDIWEQYKTFNDSALKSRAFGFLYDPGSVANELTALAGVQAEYATALETGSVSDTEKTLKEFNDKLYAAGLQKVIDLKQEQLDAWWASR
jgi:putative aldouronate transport system substrate-binding protein